MTCEKMMQPFRKKEYLAVTETNCVSNGSTYSASKGIEESCRFRGNYSRSGERTRTDDEITLTTSHRPNKLVHSFLVISSHK
ncbi:hypothetical protein CDAR_398191 [Caerostris darwini]|uniref:Uncharacterized protein n=1 Tax=Caerostris darwini TaxID=1538125 RepID=A0AAV4WQF2_9ARAC|nr:hypothetical protein CDAR_398191 [Caerostris darwini]